MSTMIPSQARGVLTPAQIETIEANPLYPEGLSGISFDVMSGDADVRFGSVRFAVTPGGRVKSSPAQGILCDQIAEIETQIQELQRTADNLTTMVRMLMTPDQRLRCHRR